MPLFHHGYKLGKLPPRRDERTLRLARYLTPALAPPPEQCGWSGKVSSWPMDLNDTLGDCTIAAASHMIQTWSSWNEPAPVVLADSDVLAAYKAVSGYDGTPGTDNGAAELDVMKYWRSTGIGGHTIAAFAGLFTGDSRIVTEIKQAVYIFGGAYLGIELPLTAAAQDVWTFTSDNGDGAPGSWGGHAVPLIAYEQNWVWLVTWGKLIPASWGFIQAYCDEAYACLSMDWMRAPDAKTPMGLDMDQLMLDLQEVTK